MFFLFGGFVMIRLWMLIAGAEMSQWLRCKDGWVDEIQVTEVEALFHRHFINNIYIKIFTSISLLTNDRNIIAHIAEISPEASVSWMT